MGHTGTNCAVNMFICAENVILRCKFSSLPQVDTFLEPSQTLLYLVRPIPLTQLEFCNTGNTDYLVYCAFYSDILLIVHPGRDTKCMIYIA